MKITIEAEKGDGDVEMYPLTFVGVVEFVLVGMRTHSHSPSVPAQFSHIRCGVTTCQLRGQAHCAIEFLRDRAHGKSA